MGPDAHFLESNVEDYSIDESLLSTFYEAASAYIVGLEKNDLSPDFCALVSDSDAWLVGYGMDTEKRYRALDGIYTLNPPPSQPDQKQLDFQID